jgi:tetratricopeptide (TPR) repeat protein
VNDPEPLGSRKGSRAAFSFAAVICLALVLATWANTLPNGFHFDDIHYIVNNLFIRDMANAPHYFRDARTFSSIPANQTYRPLTTLSLALDYRLAGGLSSRVFHTTQIVLLVLLWAALLFFYQRIFDVCRPAGENRYLALLSATLFAVHTANADTMNLVSARSEILSALGLVGAFLAWFFLRGLRRTVVSLLSMAVGALAKITAVLFGPLLFLWNLLTAPGELARPGQRRTASGIRRAFAASAPALIAGAALFLFQRRMDGPEVDFGGGPPLSYARTQIWVWLHYLRLFVLPVGLTADTDLQLIASWFDTRVVAGALALVALAWVAVRCGKRRETWPVAFGLGWFAVALLPTSSFIPLAEPMNEHRIFLPYIGLSLAAVWGAWLLAGKIPDARVRRAVAATASATALAALAIGAHVRNEVWRSDETLWADVTRKSPANGRGWTNYGLALMARGELIEARSTFERAETLTPNYWPLEIDLGIVNGSLGEQRLAEAHFRKALDLAPNFPDSHFYFARWLVEQGKSPEALAYLDRAIVVSPAYEAAHLLRMDLLAARGDVAGARRAGAEYLGFEPSNRRARSYASGVLPVRAEEPSCAAYLGLGLVLGQQKNFVESALAYRGALEVDPRCADALNNLGWTLNQLGFLQEAIPILEKALEIRPDFPLARNNLAWARRAAGQSP